MFETLFTYPKVVRRHRDGPLADERAAYLVKRAAQGVAHATLIKEARISLRVAVELDRWPADHGFSIDEVREVASRCAARCRGEPSRHARNHFRTTALDWLRHLGRLRPEPTGLPHRYETMLHEFIAHRRERNWLSDATCQSARWQITRFLKDLEQRGRFLEATRPADVDVFYQRMAYRWNRRSLSRSVSFLRAWFSYCEDQGTVRPGLARTLLAPRINRHETLPKGPTWETVGHMLAATGDDSPAGIRDHAILLLLSIYGVRSGEVRRLCIDDIDWRRNRIRFVRSKGGNHTEAPLIARVGNAIARYLREVRPQSESRAVFLRLRAPFAPLSSGGLYNAVERYFPEQGQPPNGRGPHGLRHACARNLLESGLSVKEVGDHLGHRDPDTTRIYAKVNLSMLRRVAFEDLGGLK
ncbi:MAG: tyrosine-type recombinase/integrase [Rhodospirillales bacterium]|nr:tyrosine-type recombinase/integrase [Rhodospirillales bacterium]